MLGFRLHRHPLPGQTWLLTVILAMTFGCYAQLISHHWMNWDDPWLVIQNPWLQELQLKNLKAIFGDFSLSTRLALGAEYLPIRDLSVLFDNIVFGTWAGGHLLHNLLFYMVALILLFFLLESWFADRLMAFLITLLFALHPVHVESVAWVSSRKDLVSLLFVFASLLSFEYFLRRRHFGLALLTLVGFSLSMLSKSTAMTLPLLILGRWLISDQARPNLWKTLRRTPNRFPWRSPGFLFAVLLALLMILHVGIVLHVGHLVGMRATPIHEEGWLNLFSILDIVRRYFSNLLLPIGLTPVPEVLPVSPWGLAALPTWFLALSLCGSIIWLLLSYRQQPKHRPATLWLIFGLAWMFLTWLPVSQLWFPLQNKMADRYLLLPSLGFAIVTVQLLTGPWLNTRRLKKGGFLILGALTALYAWITLMQVRYWHDPLTLWERAVDLEPTNSRALLKLADTYREHHWRELESAVLTRLLALHPENVKALNNLAISRHALGESAENLIPTYQQILKLTPGNLKAMHNLGVLLLKVGKSDEAIAWLSQALKHQPDYCSALYHLGRAQLQKQQTDLARHYFDQAVSCDPNFSQIKLKAAAPIQSLERSEVESALPNLSPQ